MIPRTINPHISETNHIQSSPKFGSGSHNSYGIRNSQFERQSLLDQIINNCQRAQSPLKGRRPGSNNKNNIIKTNLLEQHQKDKQNSRNYLSPNTYQKLGVIRRQLNQSNASKSSNDTSKEKIAFNFRNSNTTYTPFIQTQASQNREYFPTTSKPLLSSPTYKFKTNVSEVYKAKPKETPPPSIRVIPAQPLISSDKNPINQQQKLKRKIEQERQLHLEHCKKQQRKLRLYYVQLQNKLCEMRNRQLKSLAEYEATKLKQYQNCFKTLGNIGGAQQCNTKLLQLNKNPAMRVDQNVKVQITGCLTSGINGVYFSFDQSNTNDINIL